MYWVDRQTRRVSFYNLKTLKYDSVNLPENIKPTTIAVGDGILYFFDESSPQEYFIGSVLLNSTREISYLRNRTSRIKALKLFHPDLQQGFSYLFQTRVSPLLIFLSLGENACSSSKILMPPRCLQLCLPLPGGRKTCQCTTGYQLSTTKDTCVGEYSELLILK